MLHCRSEQFCCCYLNCVFRANKNHIKRGKVSAINRNGFRRNTAGLGNVQTSRAQNEMCVHKPSHENKELWRDCSEREQQFVTQNGTPTVEIGLELFAQCTIQTRFPLFRKVLETVEEDLKKLMGPNEVSFEKLSNQILSIREVINSIRGDPFLTQGFDRNAWKVG